LIFRTVIVLRLKHLSPCVKKIKGLCVNYKCIKSYSQIVSPKKSLRSKKSTLKLMNYICLIIYRLRLALVQ